MPVFTTQAPPQADGETLTMEHHIVLRVVAKAFIPVILLFALYVLFADKLLGIMGFDVADGSGSTNADQVLEIGRTYLYIMSSSGGMMVSCPGLPSNG